MTATRIIQVVNENGHHITSSTICDPCGFDRCGLYQIADGPHAGERGLAWALFDLVGPTILDRESVSVDRKAGSRND